jgi:hypothetical protein
MTAYFQMIPPLNSNNYVLAFLVYNLGSGLKNNLIHQILVIGTLYDMLHLSPLNPLLLGTGNFSLVWETLKINLPSWIIRSLLSQALQLKDKKSILKM